MVRVAAIDCGTNSLRLLVADVSTDHLTDVVRRMEIVRLGQDVDRTRRLAPDALARTQHTLVEFAEQSRILGAEKIRVVATSAIRDADNNDEFSEIVRQTLGIYPDIITGGEEAALTFTGAVVDLPDIAPPCLVVDIGGGSTELVFGQPSVPQSPDQLIELSMDVGCVRMTERYFHDDPPTEQQVAAAEHEVKAAVSHARRHVLLDQAQTVVGVAGSVTTVAALAMHLPFYDATRIHHSRISTEAVRDVAATLLQMSHNQRLALGAMHPGRADVIAAGALILETILTEASADSVVVSEHDILDGIARSLV